MLHNTKGYMNSCKMYSFDHSTKKLVPVRCLAVRHCEFTTISAVRVSTRRFQFMLCASLQKKIPLKTDSPVGLLLQLPQNKNTRRRRILNSVLRHFLLSPGMATFALKAPRYITFICHRRQTRWTNGTAFYLRMWIYNGKRGKGRRGGMKIIACYADWKMTGWGRYTQKLFFWKECKFLLFLLLLFKVKS